MMDAAEHERRVTSSPRIIEVDLMLLYLLVWCRDGQYYIGAFVASFVVRIGHMGSRGCAGWYG